MAHVASQPQLTFTLMSYNTLADELATTHAAELYQLVPRHCIPWQQRGQRLMQEIAHFRPDLIALQEVDHLDAFQAALHPLGYKSVYAQRSGGRVDGCATFWNTAKFREVANHTIRFSEHDLRDNVALILVVEHVGATCGGRAPRLVLGNIHVLFNPKRGDIKLAQVRVLASRVEQLAAQHGAAAILAGDFNSTPESSIYSFCARGQLGLAATDRRTMSGQVEDGGSGRLPASPSTEALTSDVAAVKEYKRMGWSLEDLNRGVGSAEGLPVRDDWIARHPLQLTSAYCHVTGSEPPYTTCHSKNTATVDYQWFTASSAGWRLRPLAVLQPPPLERIGSAKLPSMSFASDHICLLCEYAVYEAPPE